MSARSPLFEPIQMWWADPFHENLPFVRPFPPKHSEEHMDLRYLSELRYQIPIGFEIRSFSLVFTVLSY